MKKTIVFALLILFAVTASAQNIQVSVKQVNDRRTNGFFAQLALNLELPKVQSSEVAASRVLVSSATDETGRDLIDREAQEPRLEPNQRLAGPMASEPAQVSLTLKNPDRRATKVKEVRGEIELFMPAKDPNSVAEIGKFTTLAGKSLSHKALKANGVEITLLTQAQVDAEKKKRADAKRKEYADMGFDTESLENMLKSFLETLLQVEESELVARVKDPQGRIQQINYVDASGQVKHVSVRDDEGLVRLATWEGKPQADWKLRVSMRTPKNTARFAFALNDVPLP